MNLSSSQILQRHYDILLDKGTYDAISLSPVDSKAMRTLYIQNVRKLLNAAGILWMTSCNWTSEELTEHFTCDALFIVREVVPVQAFKFGGKVGQTVCCVVFTAV